MGYLILCISLMLSCASESQFSSSSKKISEASDLQMEPDPCEEASAGRIVLTHDEWLFSNKGFSEGSDTAAFLRNVSEWLRKCNRQTGNKFHAFSKDFSLNESGLAQVLSNSGYTFTVGLDFDPSINNLKKYDWIYLAGPPGDLDSATFSSLMEKYVNEGGNLLIAGGTGSFDNTHKGEAVFFNPFLQKFGLKYSEKTTALKEPSLLQGITNYLTEFLSFTIDTETLLFLSMIKAEEQSFYSKRMAMLDLPSMTEV